MKPVDTTVDLKDGRGTDSNPDPITGQPGAHPVGTGVGAAVAGAAAGAAGGLIGGPVGAAVGAVIGGVAGGLAGKGVAESIDPTVEDGYWRKTTRVVLITTQISLMTTTSPRTNTAGNRKQKTCIGHSTRPKKRMSRQWNSVKARSTLTWDKAKHATRDAWNRIEQPGR